RFVMSLRATGEGHISSVVFHTGVIDAQHGITLDDPSRYFTPLQIRGDSKYTKDFIYKRAALSPDFNKSILDLLPDSFSASEANQILKSTAPHDPAMVDSIVLIEKILDTNYELEPSSHLSINEKVIFPHANTERMGMEDVRFVKFT